MPYNPCWHFLVKLLTVVVSPILSDDLIRVASRETSHSCLWRDHTRVLQIVGHTTASVVFIWETSTKIWLTPELGIRVQQLKDVELLGLRCEMRMN